MNRSILMAALLLASTAYGAANSDGQAGFEQFCSGCHPQGGNSINPAKPLFKMEREANGIRNAADIVRVMRKPGQGMRAYTKKDISDERAKAIAEYILVTF